MPLRTQTHRLHLQRYPLARAMRLKPLAQDRGITKWRTSKENLPQVSSSASPYCSANITKKVRNETKMTQPDNKYLLLHSLAQGNYIYWPISQPDALPCTIAGNVTIYKLKIPALVPAHRPDARYTSVPEVQQHIMRA